MMGVILADCGRIACRLTPAVSSNSARHEGFLQIQRQRQADNGLKVSATPFMQ